MSFIPFPKDFDVNEWFVIISLAISYTVLFRLRRGFPESIVILIILYSATVARAADHVLAGPNLDLYDLMDTGKFDLFDILSYFIYGPFAYIFLYFYQKLNIKGINILFYTVIWSLLSVAYEWITVEFGMFTYKEWESIYSFPVYLFVQTLTILYYQFFLRYWVEKCQ